MKKIPFPSEITDGYNLNSRAYVVQELLDMLGDVKNRLNVVVLDACRDLPKEWKLSGSSRGLSAISVQPVNSIIVYSTSEESASAEFEDGEIVVNLSPDDGAVVELFALWGSHPYFVAYDANGGTGEMEPSSFAYGIGQSLRPNAFSREGHVFAGWSRTAAGDAEFADGQIVDSLTESSGATVTLYAQWELNRYTVTFNSAEGSAVEPVLNAGHGSFLNKPPDPDRDGYTFDGWHTEAACINRWSFETDAVTGNMTLYAKWLKNHTVAFIAFGSQPGTLPEDQTVTDGFFADRPDNPLRGGFFFEGWYKDTGFAEAWDFTADAVAKDEFLHGKWETLPPGHCTVRFMRNGGIPFAEDLAAETGSMIEEPVLSRNGFSFGGWFKDEDCLEDPWLFADDVVNADITLYAKWNPTGHYTVNFLSNGGTPAPAQQVVAMGGNVNEIEISHEYYIFDGWYTDSVYTEIDKWTLASDRVTENLNLYAKWYIDVDQELFDPGNYILGEYGEFVVDTPQVSPFRVKEIYLDTLQLVGGGGGGGGTGNGTGGTTIGGGGGGGSGLEITVNNENIKPITSFVSIVVANGGSGGAGGNSNGGSGGSGGQASRFLSDSISLYIAGGGGGGGGGGARDGNGSSGAAGEEGGSGGASGGSSSANAWGGGGGQGKFDGAYAGRTPYGGGGGGYLSAAVHESSISGTGLDINNGQNGEGWGPGNGGSGPGGGGGGAGGNNWASGGNGGAGYCHIAGRIVARFR